MTLLLGGQTRNTTGQDLAAVGDETLKCLDVREFQVQGRAASLFGVGIFWHEAKMDRVLAFLFKSYF